MTAREYLEQIKMLDAKVNNKIKELEQYRQMAFSIRSPSDLSADRVQSSMEGDKFGAIIAKIVDAEEEINQMVDEFVDKKTKVISTIERIPEADVYDVIHKHYVQMLTFEVIAEQTHYSDRWVIELHKRGLQTVDNLLKDCT